MKIRKFHKIIGIILAPFFLITGFTAIILLFRKDDLYDKEVKNLLLSLHNWEYGAKYIGVILALGLICMTITGLIIAFKSYQK